MRDGGRAGSESKQTGATGRFPDQPSLDAERRQPDSLATGALEAQDPGRKTFPTANLLKHCGHPPAQLGDAQRPRFDCQTCIRCWNGFRPLHFACLLEGANWRSQIVDNFILDIACVAIVQVSLL